MQAAKDKGIPVFECYATDVPSGEENGIYADCYDSSAAAEYGKALTDWVISDSGGTANTLIVSLPAFPILTAQQDAVQAEFKTCSGCKTDVLAATVPDLSSGAVPQNIASYLQTHTAVDYVYITYAGLDTGVVTALQSADLLSKVKIVGTQAASAQLQEIIDGTERAWTALPQENAMWTLVDQMARVATNQWSAAQERKTAVPPFYLVTTPEQAQAIVDFKNGWPGPDGFEAAYKKLWGV